MFLKKKEPVSPRELLFKGKLPSNLKTQHLDLSNLRASSLQRLPQTIECHSLDLSGSSLEVLPSGWKATYRLILNRCDQLKELPPGLRVSVLTISNCSSLTSLPEGLQTNFLDATGCRNLQHWPSTATISIGALTLRGCSSLPEVPGHIGPLTTLDVRDCVRLTHIPETLVIRSWLDIAGTGITGLPASLAHVPLRWKGVTINAQIAFFPESLSVPSILEESNAEVRRVMIERVGFERFLKDANAEVIHSDTDPGGKRELVRVRLQNDEDLVCVSVRCPSTGRQYLIRVPPTMKTCHQAVAWTAGFDNSDDYCPVVET